MRLALALLAALVVAVPANAQAPLTIYSSLPLQGPASADAQDIVRAMNMALEEAGGTAAGRPVRHVSLNDAGADGWRPQLAARNARRAATDGSTIAYLGEFNSGATAISMPITNEAGILQISPSNTYAGLTRSEGAEPGEPDKYYPSGSRAFGRVIPADHRQADALVAYLKVLGARSVYLVDDGEAFGDGIADMVARRARAAGIKVAGRSRHSGRRPAATSIARRVRRARARAMVFGGITQNRAAQRFNAVRARNPGIQMLGAEGVLDSAFTRGLTRAARARTHMTGAALHPSAYPPAGQAFMQRFRAKHGFDPSPLAIYGYETMALALACIDPGASRAATIGAFYSVRDRDSVLGRYSIDANGDTTLPAFTGYAVTRGGAARYDRTLALP